MKSHLRVVAPAAVLAIAVMAPAHATPPDGGPGAAGELPLGPAGLVESRETSILAPGVSLTRIVRGEARPEMVWTVELSIPSGEGSPDPDAPPATLKDQQSAEQLVAALRDGGFEARAEEVVTREMADYEGGSLGWRVRVGAFDSAEAAADERTRLRASGYIGSALYTGWDGEDATGPWRVDVLTIDPRHFRGSVEGVFGPDLEQRERTSDLAAGAAAIAGVNAGFFVLDPRAGAPGDPAGVGVYDGALLSEPVAGRPALLIGGHHGGNDVVRLTWVGTVSGRHGRCLALDGINRVPGLIRNCGGTADDVPTALPLHDQTCSDPDELVAFTPEYGAVTPSGPGTEVVLDARGRVTEVRSPRGGALPAGGSSVQGIGTLADDLADLADRDGRGRVRIDTVLLNQDGRRLPTGRAGTVINGGPELVRDGAVHATPATDGMVIAGNPSFYYGWVHKRNPRTFAGVDAHGRLVLVAAEGRDLDALGLSIGEAADVAQALGLRDAVNLDGGGSTAMVVGGQLITDPSDATGERAVGDAILVLPR